MGKSFDLGLPSLSCGCHQKWFSDNNETPTITQGQNYLFKFVMKSVITRTLLSSLCNRDNTEDKKRKGLTILRFWNSISFIFSFFWLAFNSYFFWLSLFLFTHLFWFIFDWSSHYLTQFLVELLCACKREGIDNLKPCMNCICIISVPLNHAILKLQDQLENSTHSWRGRLTPVWE